MVSSMIETNADWVTDTTRRCLRQTPSVLKPKRRWSFDIISTVTVEANDESDAISEARRRRLDDIDYTCTDSREVRYADWLPEPWRTGARACRFAEETFMRGVKVADESDWWATNGHLALRVGTFFSIGETPVKARPLSAKEWADIVRESEKRTRVDRWLARAHGDELVTVAPHGCDAARAEYVMFIESSGLVARWEASPAGSKVPHLAYDSMGHLLALVHAYEDEGPFVDCNVDVVLDEMRRKAAAMRSAEVDNG